MPRKRFPRLPQVRKTGSTFPLLSAMLLFLTLQAASRDVAAADPPAAARDVRVAGVQERRQESVTGTPPSQVVQDPRLRQVLDEILALREQRGNLLDGTMLEHVPAAEQAVPPRRHRHGDGPSDTGSHRAGTEREEEVEREQGQDFAQILQRVAERQEAPVWEPRQFGELQHSGHSAGLLGDAARSEPAVFELPRLPGARGAKIGPEDGSLSETLALAVRRLEERAHQLDALREYDEADQLRRLAARIRRASRRMARR